MTYGNHIVTTNNASKNTARPYDLPGTGNGFDCDDDADDDDDDDVFYYYITFIITYYYYVLYC